MITCAICGLEFDPKYLDQVIYHETHAPVEITSNKPIIGKKI